MPGYILIYRTRIPFPLNISRNLLSKKRKRKVKTPFVWSSVSYLGFVPLNLTINPSIFKKKWECLMSVQSSHSHRVEGVIHEHLLYKMIHFSLHRQSCKVLKYKYSFKIYEHFLPSLVSVDVFSIRLE